MNSRYSVIEKLVGDTPLQAIEKFRAEQKIDSGVSLAYAGRLDPMASGKLLVLIGEECKRQKEYHDLDKEYTFSVLLGLDSDTSDVLGLAKYKKASIVSQTEIMKRIKTIRGKVTFPYPVFSSKTVDGKPLFLHALEGSLDTIEVPTITSTIYKLSYLGVKTIQKDMLLEEILEKINTIPPVREESKKLGEDFRRKDIRKRWQEILTDSQTQDEFQILSLRVICSSGTYVRTLSKEIGNQLGATGLAYIIHRETIGRYMNLGAGIGFWIRRY